MSVYDYDIGVIGGGAGGLTVASGCAQLGARTLLIEKEEKLGGDCLHFGCVPSKTLIHTAKIYHQCKDTKRFGLPAMQVPEVDFGRISKHIKSVIETIQKHDSVERFCSLGVEVSFGRPQFTDEHTIKLGSRKISAKKWVLATGSSPAAPDVQGLAELDYLTNKEIFSLDKLPSSLIILGAGPVAVEMAQAFSRLGSKVMVVQRSSQILTKEDKDLADKVMQRLSQEGVNFYLNSQVSEVKQLDGEKEVNIFDSNNQPYQLRAEQILIAMGRKPNLEDLDLVNTGVEFSAKGVSVDNRMRTSQKHIFAAGDVTGKFLFTHAAGYEGSIVVSNAGFHIPRKANYSFMPWCTYTDPELASIGFNEKRASEQGLSYKIWTEEFRNNDRSLAEGEDFGLIKLILDDKEKPLGIQILGAKAGELLSEWLPVVNGSVKLTTLAGSVHPYPTLAEINKGVAGNFLRPKIFSEKVQKALKFFFHFKGRGCQPAEEQ